ncbi:MAG: DUF423 domain-containing protein [Polyangiales bacterium]
MRWARAVAAGHGFTAVALGAFGAHGLPHHLAGLPDMQLRLAWWQSAAHYQLTHALALLLTALWHTQQPRPALRFAGAAFAIGALVFSGTLDIMALGGPRWLGAITPVGGTHC